MEKVTVVDALDAAKVIKEWCGVVKSCSECVFQKNNECAICKTTPKGWVLKDWTEAQHGSF